MASFFDQFHVGPNPNNTTQERVDAIKGLVGQFVGTVRERAKPDELRALRLLRPLFLFIDVDAEHVHLVFTNSGAILGFTLCRFYAHKEDEAPHGTLEAAAVAVNQFGYPGEGLGYLSLPLQLVEQETDIRAGVVTTLANEYIKADLTYQEMRGRDVRINPVFRGRNFNVEDSLCFVLMPFAPEFRPIYDDHIAKALRTSGLQPVRADDIFTNREIIEDIWEHINRARIIVADLTGRNPNVYYEVGIAHTVGKDVILLTQSMDDVPFDLRHIRVIRYDYTPRGCAQMEAALTATVNQVILGHSTSNEA